MARVKEMDVDDASRNMTDDLVKEMEQLTAHFRSDGAIERMQRCLSSLHEWKTQIDNHRQTLQREIHSKAIGECQRYSKGCEKGSKVMKRG